jgi:hypothetical protein
MSLGPDRHRYQFQLKAKLLKLFEVLTDAAASD